MHLNSNIDMQDSQTGPVPQTGTIPQTGLKSKQVSTNWVNLNNVGKSLELHYDADIMNL